MRKTINQITLAGRVYESNIALKKVQDTSKESFGTEFINGTLDIATDEDCLNVVQVHFTYVTATTKQGKKNATFDVLKDIIENGKTVVADGKDEATCVKIDTALDLNDFYTTRDGEETLVSAKRCEGGFVSKVAKNKLPEERNRFEVDMFINGTKIVEANEEKNIPADYLIVKGAVFNFRGAIKPVDFVVKSPGGIKYFESIDASPQNPTFTKVWGNIISSTIVTRKEEESEFGEPVVKEYTRTTKEWIVTGTSKASAVYPIGDEKSGITAEEIKKALADREIYLADIKKRAEEWAASKKASNDESLPFGDNKTAAPAAAGGFNF